MIGAFQLHLLVFLVELQVQFLLLFSELEAWESGFMFFESFFFFISNLLLYSPLLSSGVAGL